MTVRDVCIGASRFDGCNHGSAVKFAVNSYLRLGKNVLAEFQVRKTFFVLPR